MTTDVVISQNMTTVDGSDGGDGGKILTRCYLHKEKLIVVYTMVLAPTKKATSVRKGVERSIPSTSSQSRSMSYQHRNDITLQRRGRYGIRSRV